MTATRTRIAIAGCGRIAATHLEALQKIQEAEVVAVADVDEQARQRLAQAARCPAYADYREMVDRHAPDIVCICTPPQSHAEISIYALEKKAHVLCEKPFALDTKSAHRMVEAAEKADRLLTMASKFRFVEDVAQAKNLAESGAIGNTVLCEIGFCSRVNMRGRWNADPAVSGGGVLIDNGSHAVDMVRYLIGPITRVQAQHGRRLQGLPVEDTSMIFVETADGVWGRIDLSWSIEKDHDAYIYLHGSDGMMVVGWRSSRYRRYDQKEWTSFGRGYNKLEAFMNQHQHFIDCVQGRRRSIITAKDSYESVRVIELAYASSRSNKWLEVGS